MNDNAISPVVGVILMVAIVVLLASLIGVTAFGFTENSPSEKDSEFAAVDDENNGEYVKLTPVKKGASDQLDVLVNGNKVGTMSAEPGRSYILQHVKKGSTVSLVDTKSKKAVRTITLDKNAGDKDISGSDPSLSYFDNSCTFSKDERKYYDFNNDGVIDYGEVKEAEEDYLNDEGFDPSLSEYQFVINTYKTGCS